MIYVLGFTVPWDAALHLDGVGPNAHVWGLLSVLLSKAGILNIATAFNAVLGAGILFALVGAWLRTWGAAYLGAGVVQNAKMQGDGVVAEGPFGYVRNPLYLGMWLHTLALALLMPVSGAIFTTILVAVFQVRLIVGEEGFLRTKLGAQYAAYCARVPRLVPALRARAASAGARPQWLQAFSGEIYMWGVAGSFAVAGWQYNAQLLIKCVLVSLGVSMVVRALTMKEQPAVQVPR